MIEEGKSGMERRTFLGALAVGALSATGLARSARRDNEVSDSFLWKEVIPDRGWVTTSQNDGGNSLVLASAGKVMLVDSKFAPLGPILRREAEERAGAPVTLFVNTHHHGDHSGGNLAFFGVDTLAHAAAKWRISQSMDQYKDQMRAADGMFGRLPSDNSADAAKKAYAETKERVDEDDVASWTPTRTIDRYPTHVKVGEVDVAFYHFGPGHTDNDVVVHIPELNVLHAGDLLFNGLHPFFDPAGGGSAAGWSRSLRNAIDLCDEKTVVIPGHGAAIADKAALQRQLDYLEGLIEAIKAAHEAGKPKPVIMGMTWPFMKDLGLPQLKPRAIAVTYDELYPEDEAQHGEQQRNKRVPAPGKPPRGPVLDPGGGGG